MQNTHFFSVYLCIYYACAPCICFHSYYIYVLTLVSSLMCGRTMSQHFCFQLEEFDIDRRAVLDMMINHYEDNDVKVKLILKREAKINPISYIIYLSDICKEMLGCYVLVYFMFKSLATRCNKVVNPRETLVVWRRYRSLHSYKRKYSRRSLDRS